MVLNNFTFVEIDSWELAPFKVACSRCHFRAKVSEICHMVDGFTIDFERHTKIHKNRGQGYHLTYTDNNMDRELT